MTTFYGAWPTSGGSSYWGDGVATVGALPAGVVVGEVRQAVDTGNLYRWDGAVWNTYFNTSGSITGPGTSVNNEIALWSGTTGSVLKRATGTGVAHVTSGVLSASAVVLTSEVSGVLPVANGGTNSSTALSNNRIMQSSSGAVVEAAAITASRALASDANGIPVASATTATELGYVSGVTSSIQTQLNAKALASRLINTTAPITGGGDLSADRTLAMPAATGSVDGYLTAVDWTAFDAKQPAGSYITDLTGDVAASGPGSAAATIQPGAVDNGKIAAGAAIDVTKLAAVTAHKALASDASGFITPSTTTDTELGYVSGVTSAIQTQLNAKALASRLINTTAPITGGGDLSADRTLAMAAATTSVDGYLTAVDWTTFNNKQPAGSYLTALTGDVTAAGPGSSAAVLASIPHKRYIDFLNGDDTTGTGTIVSPWKTIQHAYTASSPTINEPYVFFISGGNNDSDASPITGKPNVTIFSEYPIQISQPITISGGTSNDGVGFFNIIFLGALTWIRNDNSSIGMNLVNTEFFSGPIFKQTGSGTATITAQNSVFVNSDFLLPKVGSFFNNCSFLGTTTFEDADVNAYYVLASGYYDGNITINGGAAIYLSGMQTDVPFGAALTGVTTANGTPYIQSDSGSVPPTIAGAFTLYPISYAQHEAYTPSTPGDWSPAPTEVADALDQLAAAVASGGSAITSLTGDVVATGPGAAAATIQAGAVDNGKVSATAAIALTKLAALTANRATATDGSGFIVASSVTDTELGYVSGVTSAIQTQLDTKAIGQASAVDSEVALFSGTGGKQLKRATGTGVAHLTSGVLSASAVVLTSEVSGVLPVANGGTNSASALSNNRVMVSSGGAVVETAAITANRALASDGSGIPVASSVTDTELGYVSGVTSSIQTQLNNTFSLSIVAVSSNVTLTNKGIHLVDTSAARSLTLPSPTSGAYIVVKDSTGSANTNSITINPAGAEKIETAAASYVLSSILTSVTLVSDGTDWFIV